ncbi:hypothetical protein Taro_021002 [Colocasia esculenta]|uniref:Fe2OG dioxygenase domain-containing protein n=1 Tax=Colocasia esculenta TaxID=4460 RepID=A0A843UQ55_COLES|nr:hypothetical protein [Colocasia esculenta]
MATMGNTNSVIRRFLPAESQQREASPRVPHKGVSSSEAPRKKDDKDHLSNSAAAGYDLERELKQFIEAKASIKDLVDAGITHIPGFCHFPDSIRTSPPSTTARSSIPVVDLSVPRPRAVELVAGAAREWGFFLVTNHGIPLHQISAALSSVQAFNELPAETKATYSTREETRAFIFNSNLTPSMRGVASWRDNLQVATSPRLPNPETIPEVCRVELLDWDKTTRGLAARLMELLSEGLGVEAERLEGLSCLDGRVVMGNYYPYCPQPELTMGQGGHTDPAALTVLVQNEVGGLLIKKGSVFEDGEWFEVDPVPGAIIIIIGDILQIISNDEYKSAEHKVVANPHKTSRISVASFCFPGKMDDSTHYGPLQELVSKKPARYRQFTMSEHRRAMFARVEGVSSVVHNFKLEEAHTTP